MAKRKSKPPAKLVALKGRQVHRTEFAIKWLDEGTGYELWFPFRVVQVEGDTIHVPEKMYRQKTKEWQRDEREDERRNAIDDAKDERQLKNDLAAIDREFGRETKNGCFGIVLILFAVLAMLSKFV